MFYYKFVSWEPQPIELAIKTRIPAALQAFDDGNSLPLRELHIATTDPYCRIGGWCFPLVPYLKEYWVETKYYGIQKYFSLCKTDIRKELKSHVLRIIEIESK